MNNTACCLNAREGGGSNRPPQKLAGRWTMTSVNYGHSHSQALCSSLPGRPLHDSCTRHAQAPAPGIRSLLPQASLSPPHLTYLWDSKPAVSSPPGSFGLSQQASPPGSSGVMELVFPKDHLLPKRNSTTEITNYLH